MIDDKQHNKTLFFIMIFMLFFMGITLPIKNVSVQDVQISTKEDNGNISIYLDGDRYYKDILTKEDVYIMKDSCKENFTPGEKGVLIDKNYGKFDLSIVGKTTESVTRFLAILKSNKCTKEALINEKVYNEIASLIEKKNIDHQYKTVNHW